MVCVRARALTQLHSALHYLAGDPKAAGNVDHVHVGIAEVVAHELAGLRRAAARHVGDHPAKGWSGFGA